ncbi:MAG: hypothetical protein ACJAVP_002040, partial [Spirosomataceae bacterium]
AGVIAAARIGEAGEPIFGVGIFYVFTGKEHVTACGR